MIRTILISIIAFFISCNNTSSPIEPVTETKKEVQKGETTNITGPVTFGKYVCTASKYVNGYYEYQPKGSFTLEKDGTYTYLGFEKPSKGNFTVDEKGVVHFKDGYFNGGEATPIEGEQNRYYLVFPNNPDNRWTAGLK
jgi:hypothetical protein